MTNFFFNMLIDCLFTELLRRAFEFDYLMIFAAQFSVHSNLGSLFWYTFLDYFATFWCHNRLCCLSEQYKLCKLVQPLLNGSALLQLTLEHLDGLKSGSFCNKFHVFLLKQEVFNHSDLFLNEKLSFLSYQIKVLGSFLRNRQACRGVSDKARN